MGGTHSTTANLEHSDWAFFVCGIPLLVTAFHFHNIIRAIRESLRGNQRTTNMTVLVGMAMGFVMNGTWRLVGIGILPPDNSPVGLIYAFDNILPGILASHKAKIPLEKSLGIAMLVLFALFFIAETGQEFGFLHISPQTEYWKERLTETLPGHRPRGPRARIMPQTAPNHVTEPPCPPSTSASSTCSRSAPARPVRTPSAP